MISRALLVTFGCAILLVATTATAQQTTLFAGGRILTVDSRFTVAEAMAIRDDKILAVGSLAEVRSAAGSAVEIVDLRGKVVMPGFIDAHAHPVAGGAASVFENVGVDRFRSIDEALGQMKKTSVETEDWLLFINLDLATQSFAEPKLTAKHLDSISDSRPLVVWHAGGHKMTVNSEMLARLGVSADTPNPPGSEYGRFDGGEPDGNISGFKALFGALSKIEPFNRYDRLSGSVSLAREWVAKGVTTIGVAGVGTPADWKVLVELGSRDDFPLRTRNYLQWGSLIQWDAKNIKPGDGDAMTRVVGWKISADGSNQAFTGLQRDPYLDRDTRGLAYMKQAEIDSAVIKGSQRYGQMAMHGNGDAAIDNIISAVEKARAAGIDVVRPRIEHCSIVQDDQIEKLKRHGITCSFLIAHVLYWGEAFRDKVFGPEKAAKLDRAGSFERAGIPFSLHTDYSVSTLSPLEMVEVAVARRLFTDPDSILAPEERATLKAAIRGVTSVPAWQTMSEHEIGSLEAGKFADFVVLANDPREVEANMIGEIEVVETWINGRRVH